MPGRMSIRFERSYGAVLVVAAVVLAACSKEAPPVGALRWRPPQPVTSWQGVRETTAYGSDCMQDLGLGTRLPMTGLRTTPAEDCLYLNIWRPAQADGKKLPVMVWIYGDKVAPEDEATAKAVNAYWVNFAKTGNPNGNGLPAWPKMTAAGDDIMDFTNEGPVGGPDPWKTRLDVTAQSYSGQK